MTCFNPTNKNYHNLNDEDRCVANAMIYLVESLECAEADYDYNISAKIKMYKNGKIKKDVNM